MKHGDGLIRMIAWIAGAILPVVGLVTAIAVHPPWVGGALVVVGLLALTASALSDPARVDEPNHHVIRSSSDGDFADTVPDEGRRR